MIRVDQLNTADQAAKLAAEELVKGLTAHSNQQNLFLVSGGSSINVAHWASSDLDINVTNSTSLGQVDERYGPVGHDDSNWKGIIDSGIDPSLFQSSMELLELGTSAQDVADVYSRRLQQAIDESTYSIALLGMGADGHIAGMLPREEKEFVELFLGDDLVASFQGPDYERVTVTAKALLQLSKIVVFAAGPEKAEQIAKLNTEQPVHEFPAEILRNCKNVVVYYGKEK